MSSYYSVVFWLSLYAFHVFYRMIHKNVEKEDDCLFNCYDF